MEPDELLRRVVDTLESLDLPCLIIGSIATILSGEPRFTNDIDVVVQMTPSRVDDFAHAFRGDEFYLDPDKKGGLVLGSMSTALKQRRVRETGSRSNGDAGGDKPRPYDCSDASLQNLFVYPYLEVREAEIYAQRTAKRLRQ